MAEKVLLILVDGMRPDSLAACGHPYVRELTAQSRSTLSARTIEVSVTLPAHVSLFHSVTAERHGTVTNTYAPQVRPVNGLCEVLRAAGRTCAFFHSWEPLRDISRPLSLAYSQVVSGDIYGFDVADRRNTADAVALCRDKAPDFVFLYLAAPDSAGHAHGWMSTPYLAAVRQSWGYIEDAVRALGGAYTVLLTADHGGHDRCHGTTMEEDMRIPLLCRGGTFTPGTTFPGGVSILDIAPTIAALLGAAPDAAWEGHALLDS